MWFEVFLSIINNFNVKNARSRQYPTETTTDVYYAYNLALLENAPADAVSWLHPRELR